MVVVLALSVKGDAWSSADAGFCFASPGGGGSTGSGLAPRALAPGCGSDHVRDRRGTFGSDRTAAVRVSVGEDVLLDVRLRSARSRPANLSDGGWLSSAPEGAYHQRLAGQAEVG